MTELILHPTDLSQWHCMVYEAQRSASLILNETTESYLVFLLMRFSHGSKLIESVIALDFLESLNQPRYLQMKQWCDVGDKSLLFCGLFPGMAKKRHVSINYFSDLGQSAYLHAGRMYGNSSSVLYLQLSEQFPNLQKILQAMRECPALIDISTLKILETPHHIQ